MPTRHSAGGRITRLAGRKDSPTQEQRHHLIIRHKHLTYYELLALINSLRPHKVVKKIDMFLTTIDRSRGSKSYTKLIETNK
jgi:hypothetical protein